MIVVNSETQNIYMTALISKFFYTQCETEFFSQTAAAVCVRVKTEISCNCCHIRINGMA